MRKFEVWGGYPDAEDGDHFGTFDTMAEANRYRQELLKDDPRMVLHITARNQQYYAPVSDPFAERKA